MSATRKTAFTESNVNLARECLALIRDIAARGAGSEDPANVGYALQELTQVLFERDGSEERRFEPIPANLIGDLANLHDELNFVDAFSQDMAHREAAIRGGQ